MASGDAKPVPIKNTAYRITFPIYDADGDLVTGATGLDSEVSKDGGTFADCTNEATEIATSSGIYYLDLTSTEMNADTVAVIVKTSSSGAKTTVLVMYPQEAGDVTTTVEGYASGQVPLQPTTAGRTLDVTTGGCAGIDWANVEAPTTTLNLSGTTVSTSQAVASVSGAVGSVTGAVGSISGVSFPTNFASMAITGGGAVTAGTVSDKTGYSLSGTLTTIDSLWTEVRKWFRLLFRSDSSIAADYSTVIADINTNTGSGTGSYDNTQQSVQALHAHAADIETDTNELQVDWTNGGRLDLLLDAVKAKTGNLPASPAATGDIVSAAAIADAVWDEAISGHSTSGSTGEALSAAGSAGDPWSTALPGAYSAGSAGYIIGTNLNETVGSRSSHSAADVWGVATRTLTAFGFTVTTSDAGSIAAILEDTGTTLPAQISGLSIPSAATNASAVRTELATELARLDVATSTRLASASYTAPDNASITAILEDTGTTIPAQIAALSIPTTTQIADAVLSRNVSNVEGSAGEHTLCTVILAAMQSDTTTLAGYLTIFGTDGATVRFQKPIATDANANPITGVS